MNLNENNLIGILVTGGAGFIGSHFVDLISNSGRYEITVIDSLTYAANIENLSGSMERIDFQKIDITDVSAVDKLFAEKSFQKVVHFAAESHVDNSLLNPSVFIDTNIKGTQVLLDASRKYGLEKFLHISTDEVYGSIKEGSFTEEDAFNPSSPYSASKAGAEHLVNAAAISFDLPVNIVRCSNNYGPRQFSEKYIPLAITKLLNGEKIPVYGTGKNSREWLYVSDCCEAIELVLESKEQNTIYNISSGDELSNIQVASEILGRLNKNSRDLEFVADRKGHDFRYSISSEKISTELGWLPVTDFSTGIEKTINWYKTTLGAK